MTASARQPLAGRVFLLLQGPQSGFFRILAEKLTRDGAIVHKVHFCGGEVALWGFHRAHWFTGDLYSWVSRLGEALRRYGITDLCVYGDWRPLHWEAVRLARLRGIRVWIYEEGYLRSYYSTLEEDGVNGRSRLPKDPKVIREVGLPLEEKALVRISNTLPGKVWRAILYHAGNALFWPVFHHYRTHRPMNIGRELFGILPRYLTRGRRIALDGRKMEAFTQKNPPYFFFPLQLNTDSQIQLYSPYVRMQEVIADVLTSFARNAPGDCHLLIKNHPLDNGFIKYRRFIEVFAQELDIAERVTFVESGNVHEMLAGCLGVVLVNSTVGLSALEQGKPVYCLGSSVYNIKGLTQSRPWCELSEFWLAPGKPDAELFCAFQRIVQHFASVSGNFYSRSGMLAAAVDSARRFASEDSRPWR